MKKFVIHLGLILLSFAVVAGVVFIAPRVLKMFSNASFRFVIFFLLIIVISNVLARIAYKYFEV